MSGTETRTGSSPRCKQCLKRWRWNQDARLWEEHPDKACPGLPGRLPSRRPPPRGRRARAAAARWRSTPDPRGVGLQLGRSRRLKGDWKRSAKILEREVGMYNNQPSAQERAPHTVDILVIYPDRFDIQAAAAELEMTSTMLPASTRERLPGGLPARQHAQRALRRLRPHVLYLSFLDRAFGTHECDLAADFLKEQTAAGRAVVMLGPAGLEMRTLEQQPGANTCELGAGPGSTILLTTVPAGAAAAAAAAAAAGAAAAAAGAAAASAAGAFAAAAAGSAGAGPGATSWFSSASPARPGRWELPRPSPWHDSELRAQPRPRSLRHLPGPS